jgi:ubiquinone/menaquinone biosynthesis C-methylase UbiE
MFKNRLNNRDLGSRHSSEEEFHDLKYTKSHASPAHYKYHPTYRVFLRMKETLGDVHGKRILECGCGNGWVTAEIASMGGIIDAFDISKEAVDKTKQFLARKNLARDCTVNKMAAEELNYPDNSFDIVLGFAILHHLDLERAMPELYRVMKPSGSAFFAEPLGSNPIINLYRKLTPKYRTSDEHPLILKEFYKHVIAFKRFSHEEFYLTALFSFALIYLPFFRRFFNPTLKPLVKADEILIKYFPNLGKWAWYTIIRVQK